MASSSAVHARRTLVALLAAHTLIFASSESVRACDVCAVYTIEELGELRHGPRIAVAEQYTRFATTMKNGTTVPNPANEFLNSSITQVVGGWRFTDWLDAQISIPVIHRSWRRVFDGGVEEESRTGLGDVAAVTRIRALSAQSERGLLRLSGFGGLTFPSGDSSFLAPEKEEGPAEEMLGYPAHAGTEHSPQHSPSSAVHGHDLAFGTGSVNGLIGAEAFGTWDRFLGTGNVQYTIYSEGSYQYRFANELSFAAGLGYYLWLENDLALALQGVVSGDTKGKDEQAGTSVEDTALTYLYAGPRLLVRVGSKGGVELQGEIPFVRNETSLQIAPNWRIQAALSWKF